MSKLSFGTSTNSLPLRKMILAVPKTIAPQNIKNRSDSVLYSCENNVVAKNIDMANSKTAGNYLKKLNIRLYLNHKEKNSQFHISNPFAIFSMDMAMRHLHPPLRNNCPRISQWHLA